MKKIFIVHGWGNSGQDYWIPWVKSKLEEKGYTVYNPDFPNSNKPKLSEWTKTARSTIPIFDESCSIIAYSSGVMFTLQLLVSLEGSEMIDKYIGVAPFDEPLSIGAEETRDFYRTPLSYSAVKKKARKFFLICSDNDPYIPLSIPQRMKEKLDAELHIVKGGGLLNAKSGYTHPKEILSSF